MIPNNEDKGPSFRLTMLDPYQLRQRRTSKFDNSNYNPFTDPDFGATETPYGDSAPLVRPTFVGSRNPLRPERKPRPKKHRAGSRLLTEAEAPIEVDMLGRPARAIIMREGVYTRGPRPTMPSDEYAKPTKLEALLAKEREPATREEIRANIESLRPVAETSLMGKEFRKLQKALVTGFMKPQLRDYIEHFGKPSKAAELSDAAIDEDMESDEVEDAEASEDVDSSESDALEAESAADEESNSVGLYDWLQSMTPWEPLPTPRDKSVGAERGNRRTSRGYLSEMDTEKEKLASKILHECWGLVSPELNTSLGETKIKIRRHEFTLLMREYSAQSRSGALPFLS